MRIFMEKGSVTGPRQTQFIFLVNLQWHGLPGRSAASTDTINGTTKWHFKIKNSPFTMSFPWLLQFLKHFSSTGCFVERHRRRRCWPSLRYAIFQWWAWWILSNTTSQSLPGLSGQSLAKQALGRLLHVPPRFAATDLYRNLNAFATERLVNHLYQSWFHINSRKHPLGNMSNNQSQQRRKGDKKAARVK